MLIEDDAWQKSNMAAKIHFAQVMALNKAMRFNCIIDFYSSLIRPLSFRTGVWLSTGPPHREPAALGGCSPCIAQKRSDKWHRTGERFIWRSLLSGLSSGFPPRRVCLPANQRQTRRKLLDQLNDVKHTKAI
jgi:hypothetical protein